MEKQIDHIKNTLTDLKKMFIFTKNLVFSFENNQIITTSCIVILTYKMTMNKRFNMIGLITVCHIHFNISTNGGHNSLLYG